MTDRLLAIVLAAVAAAAVAIALSASRNPAAAWTCQYKGEYESDMNKVCIYDCPNGDAAITVSAARICPMTIKQ